MADRVDICVATYRRPQLLRKLLDSLARQTARAAIRVIVVDNDAGRSAAEAVADFQAENKLEVIYDVEPQQGISHARNRALRHVQAPVAAFLDDDEQAAPDWLDTMLTALDRYAADAVFGPVQGLLPADAPEWARVHPSFRRPRRVSGETIAHGGAGNVLFRGSLFADQSDPFDAGYARTGGEDTELFARLHANGRRLVWCDEAQVFECIPQERLTVGWVLRRAFRGGQTYFRIFVACQPVVARVAWLAVRLFAILVSPLWLPVVAIRGPSALVLYLTRASGWLGQLSQAAGRRFEYEEYQGNRTGE